MDPAPTRSAHAARAFRRTGMAGDCCDTCTDGIPLVLNAFSCHQGECICAEPTGPRCGPLSPVQPSQPASGFYVRQRLFVCEH